MKWLIAKYILFPLTIRNFKKRILGKKPDKWYWADKLLLKWGYFIKYLGPIKHDSLFVLGKGLK